MAGEYPVPPIQHTTLLHVMHVLSLSKNLKVFLSWKAPPPVRSPSLLRIDDSISCTPTHTYRVTHQTEVIT